MKKSKDIIHSLYLDDYITGMRERISVVITSHDYSRPSFMVKLRMSIKASGFSLTTLPYAVFQPIIVETGLPYRLSQQDLAPYFNPQNLSASGIGGYAWQKERKLPEGTIYFCFEVLDYVTGRLLSNQTCGMAWISARKPSMLNFPQDKTLIKYSDPPNILFQWTPAQSGYGTLGYELIVKQLFDEVMAPEAAWAYSPVILSEELRSTSFVYNAMAPPLTPGGYYAWAVRAIVYDGMDEIKIFENNGLSEIRTFRIEDWCPQPTGIRAQADKGKIFLEWTPEPQHLEYVISYRHRDVPDAEWYDERTRESKIILRGLRPGTWAEYKIGTICRFGAQPTYGQTHEIEIPPLTTPNPDCGKGHNIVITNFEPLLDLKKGDTFYAGDFPVYVLELESGEGEVFNGLGYTFLSMFFDGVKLLVNLKDVVINTDRQMIGGKIIGVTDFDESQIVGLGGGNSNNILEDMLVILEQIKLIKSSEEHQKLLDDLKNNLKDIENADTLISQLEHLKKNYDEHLAAADSPDYNENAVSNISSEYEQTKEMIKEEIKARIAPSYDNFIPLIVFTTSTPGETSVVCLRKEVSESLYPQIKAAIKKAGSFFDTANFVFTHSGNSVEYRENARQKLMFYLAYRRNTTDTLKIISHTRKIYMNNNSASIDNASIGLDESPYKQALGFGENIFRYIAEYNGKTDSVKLAVLNNVISVSSCRIKAELNGRITLYKNEDIIGDKKLNENPLNVDDIITLSMVRITGNDTVELQSVVWENGNNKETAKTLKIKVADINPSNGIYIYPDINILNTSNQFVLKFNVEQRSAELNKYNIDVTALPATDTIAAKNRFYNRINKMRNHRTATYKETLELLHKRGFTVFVRPQNYGKFNNEPNLFGYTNIIGIQKGWDDVLDITDIKLDNDSLTIKDVTIVQKIADGDKQGIKLAIEKKKEEGNTAQIIKQIENAGDNALVAKLRGWIAKGEVYNEQTQNNDILMKSTDITPAERLQLEQENDRLRDSLLASIVIKITKDDQALKCFNTIQGGYLIYINHNRNNDNDTFGKTLVHEMRHCWWQEKNPLNSLKWVLIQQKQRQYNYKLADTPADNAGCSSGASHEKNNPEDRDVCNFEKNF
ncbi:MAG: hypothetical protein LBD59_01105 [Prevotellaceae bacterium]|jgi:hypothetical protein|nr:hypothetical protein [Prevotellaceae bacterium]